MRNAIGHQCKVKTSGRKKKVNENTYDIIFRQKTCNYKARFKRLATAVSNSTDRVKFDFSTAVVRRLKPSRATAVPNSINKL